MKRTSLIRNATLLFLLICLSSEVLAIEAITEDSILANLAFEYGTKGYNSLTHDINLDTAEYYLKKALELQYTISNYRIDERVAINHVSLASVYRKIYNNSEALYHLNRAEKILNDDNDPNNLLFGNIYHNKGNIYRVKNDVYRTKEYYEYALNFTEKNGYHNTTNFSHIFSNYLDLLFDIKEFKLAEDLLSKVDLNSLKVSPEIELNLHLTNAYAYSILNNYNSAVFHMDKAREIIEKNEIAGLNDLKINYYCQNIDFHILYAEYKTALKECDQAFSFVESLDPLATKNKSNYQSFILYRSATINFRQGNLDRALRLVDAGLSKLNEFFIELSLSDVVANVSNENSSVLTELYVLKSRILQKIYANSRSLADLKSSHEANKLAIQKLNSLKLSMIDEDSKVFATSQILEVYYEAIIVGKLLYEKTGEIEYIEESFRNCREQ